MALPPLLRKELRWGWRKKIPLVVLFVVVPAVFVSGTLAFEHVLPTSVPVAVAPQTPNVTSDDLTIVNGAVTLFSQPVTYPSKSSAMTALSREQVYAVVTVPANLTASAGRAVIDIYVSGSVVPYQEPAQVLAAVADRGLSTLLDRPVDATYTIVGTEHTLSAYLLPTFLMVLVLLVAFAYLPYNLASEEAAIDRLRLESSLSRVVATKLGVFAALVAVPILVFEATSEWMGNSVALLSPGVFAIYLLTFLLCGTLAAAITVALRFSAWGRLANLAVLIFTVAFSGLAYPRGFFSPVRREFVQHVPTYYAMVAARGYALRDQPLGAYTDWLAMLVGVLAVCIGLFVASATYYERRV